ncbi:hypothetical protein BR93DRAFT_921720 [Coniochaeta sp. PMI_546]|nr:hypothetical protein BR93DRAFT_921720 [Coniochaeta sp. PMI_546]
MRLRSPIAILSLHGLRCFESAVVALGCAPSGAGIRSEDSKLVRASVLAPAKMTAKALARPPGAEQVGCAQKSRSPSWDIRGLYYDRVDFGPPCISPSGTCGGPFGPPQTLYYGELAFDVINTATDESHHCDVRYLGLSDLDTGHEEWLPCVDSIIFINVREPPGLDHITSTFFRFNHTSNMLELNQTWYCSDTDDHNEYSFTAYGAVSSALDASAAYIGNRALGQIRVNGSSPNITVSATIESEQRLPHNTHQQAFRHS